MSGRSFLLRLPVYSQSSSYWSLRHFSRASNLRSTSRSTRPLPSPDSDSAADNKNTLFHQTPVRRQIAQTILERKNHPPYPRTRLLPVRSSRSVATQPAVAAPTPEMSPSPQSRALH